MWRGKVGVESFMKVRPNCGTEKHKLIHNILRLNKIAIKTFRLKELTFEELYEMKINDLRNLETELLIQLGINKKRNPY